ncbi:hypothetical protein MRX96_053131 [Rhipicephalus microplus]
MGASFCFIGASMEKKALSEFVLEPKIFVRPAVRPCPAADTGGPILWIAGSAALTSVVPCNAGNCYIILLLDVQDSAADGIWHRKHWDCVMIWETPLPPPVIGSLAVAVTGDRRPF